MICAVGEYVFVCTGLKRREFKVTAVIIHVIRSAKGDNVEGKETLKKNTHFVSKTIFYSLSSLFMDSPHADVS